MERNENGLNVLFDGQWRSADTARDDGGIGNCSDARDRAMPNDDANTAKNSCMSRHPSGNDVQLAMVYSPYQCFRMTYAPDEALMRGTLFEELDKPLEEY